MFFFYFYTPCYYWNRHKPNRCLFFLVLFINHYNFVNIILVSITIFSNIFHFLNFLVSVIKCGPHKLFLFNQFCYFPKNFTYRTWTSIIGFVRVVHIFTIIISRKTKWQFFFDQTAHDLVKLDPRTSYIEGKFTS